MHQLFGNDVIFSSSRVVVPNNCTQKFRFLLITFYWHCFKAWYGLPTRNFSSRYEFMTFAQCCQIFFISRGPNFQGVYFISWQGNGQDSAVVRGPSHTPKSLDLHLINLVDAPGCGIQSHEFAAWPRQFWPSAVYGNSMCVCAIKCLSIGESVNLRRPATYGSIVCSTDITDALHWMCFAAKSPVSVQRQHHHQIFTTKHRALIRSESHLIMQSNVIS